MYILRKSFLNCITKENLINSTRRGNNLSKTYIINTNRSNQPIDEKDMLNNKKCATYNGYWKFYIDEISANDMIFLYSSGIGIIARGIASGISEVKAYNGREDEEHYMELDRFQILKTPLPAATIKQIIEYDIKLTDTVTTLADKFGLEVWRYITKNCI